MSSLKSNKNILLIPFTWTQNEFKKTEHLLTEIGAEGQKGLF